MLNKEELYNLLQDDLGLNEEQCNTYHHLLDKNVDGLVSFKEFALWLQSGQEFKTITDKTRYYYLQQADAIFSSYDTNRNLAIDQQEFRRLYKDLGGVDSEHGEYEIMYQLDLDKDGRFLLRMSKMVEEGSN